MVLRPRGINEKLTEKLLTEIEELKAVFEVAIERAKNQVDKNMDIEQYKKINNIIIDLENDVINLTMLSGE